MKTLKLIFCLISFTILVSCKKESKAELNIKKDPITQSALIKQGVKNIPDNVDDSFETFFEYFNKDSLFQISRIDFPITVMELDWKNDYADIEMIIELKDYHVLDLTYDKSYELRESDKYTQETLLDENKAIIKIRGIDNGIYSDYEFEKNKGKWKLKTWNDSST